MRRFLLWSALFVALLVLAAGGLLARGVGRVHRNLTRKEEHDARFPQLQP
jgi:hypothetical protein